MALFPSGPGGGAEVGHGYKGKGVLIHLLVEEDGNPIAALSTSAGGDERLQVERLLERVPIRRWINDHREMLVLEADKGYDSTILRQQLLRKQILPVIPYRKNRKDKIPLDEVCKTFLVIRRRWKVERAISWIKRKYRRLLMRWERLQEVWMGFIQLSLIAYWLTILLR